VAEDQPPIPEPAGYRPFPSDTVEHNDDWHRILSAGKIGSAHAARFALSYLLNGNERHLERAKRWAMNLLEECGGRVCGTDYLFCHALDEIPEDIPPMEALARMALADPMVVTSADRAERICRDVVEFKAEGVAVCRIPGASHCAFEGRIIADMVRSRLALPVVEFEVPPLSDSMNQTLRNCIEGLVEIVKERRGRDMRRN